LLEGKGEKIFWEGQHANRYNAKKKPRGDKKNGKGNGETHRPLRRKEKPTGGMPSHKAVENQGEPWGHDRNDAGKEKKKSVLPRKSDGKRPTGTKKESKNLEELEKGEKAKTFYMGQGEEKKKLQRGGSGRKPLTKKSLIGLGNGKPPPTQGKKGGAGKRGGRTKKGKKEKRGKRNGKKKGKNNYLTSWFQKPQKRGTSLQGEVRVKKKSEKGGQGETVAARSVGGNIKFQSSCTGVCFRGRGKLRRVTGTDYLKKN